jgi:DNA-binding MarR family transcriptional regulator
MTASHQDVRRGADPGNVALISISTSYGAAGVVEGHHARVVTAQDITWLVAHLRAVVVASPAVWAVRGVTLGQLTALHLIGALAPVNLTELAQALGTRPPATSAMVDRLTHAGLVCRIPDPNNRRRVKLTLTVDAQQIIGDTDTDTAKRLHAVLNGMSAKAHRHLIDVLIDAIQRSGE